MELCISVNVTRVTCLECKSIVILTIEVGSRPIALSITTLQQLVGYSHTFHEVNLIQSLHRSLAAMDAGPAIPAHEGKTKSQRVSHSRNVNSLNQQSTNQNHPTRRNGGVNKDEWILKNTGNLLESIVVGEVKPRPSPVGSESGFESVCSYSWSSVSGSTIYVPGRYFIIELYFNCARYLKLALTNDLGRFTSKVHTPANAGRPSKR